MDDSVKAHPDRLHAITFALFVWFGLWTKLAWPWYVGLALTAAAFIYQHRVVTPDDLSKVNRAFFTANGFVGIVLFLFGLRSHRLGGWQQAGRPAEPG